MDSEYSVVSQTVSSSVIGLPHGASVQLLALHEVNGSVVGGVLVVVSCPGLHTVVHPDGVAVGGLDLGGNFGLGEGDDAVLADRVLTVPFTGRGVVDGALGEVEVLAELEADLVVGAGELDGGQSVLRGDGDVVITVPAPEGGPQRCESCVFSYFD